MSETEREALAEVLREHTYTYPDSFCSCGAYAGTDPWREHAAHVADALHALLAQVKATARAEGLQEAADAWQWGEWANAPRMLDRVQERIANAQFVIDWLRDRARSLGGAR